jgi:hypothetical protein
MKRDAADSARAYSTDPDTSGIDQVRDIAPDRSGNTDIPGET